MTTTTSQAPGFWARGGFTKALMFAVLYVGVQIAVAYAVNALWGDIFDASDMLGTATNVFFSLGVALIVSSIIFVGIVFVLGWAREIFGKQPDLKRSWWMWILPLVVLVFNVFKFAGFEWGSVDTSAVVTLFALSLLIGVSEEVLARGLFISALRRAGYKELAVALLSSLLFAGLHILTVWGQDPTLIVVLLVFTFFFGVAMYFLLRVTRSIIWPILLHATTDPGTFLLTGGVDKTGDVSGLSSLAQLGLQQNIIVILVGLILVWFVRGQVDRYRTYGLGEPASAPQQ